MSAAPRIAFFGSSLVSAYWNGAATYYRGLLRALAAAGFEVTFYEPDAFERQAHRDIPDPPWARVVVYDATASGAAAAIEQAQDADLLVKASGVGVNDEFLEAAVASGVRSNQLRVFWDVDAPATLARVQADPDDAFRRCIPQFDIVFTYGGGEPVIAAYLALEARRVVPIYNAVDTSTHFPVPARREFRSDLTFLGNRLPDRETRVEEFFLKPARELPTCRFLLGGAGWDARSLPSNVGYLGHVGTADHNSVNSSASAVLNVNRSSMAEYGFSPPTRVFEAAGAGACVITDCWDGVDQFLEPGREVLVAASGGDVTELLARVDERERSAIGAAARRRVMQDHTYTQRAAAVVEALEIPLAR
jgi:spore maturation protein CgeB